LFVLHINSACGDDDKEGDLKGETMGADIRLSSADVALFNVLEDVECIGLLLLLVVGVIVER
jgi:hypothetical protein